MIAPRRVPMFPLGTVVVPHTPLPLRVFEPRYRALLDDVRRAGDGRFGTVLIERGSEVGGGDQRTDVGTLVSLAQVEDVPAEDVIAVLAVGVSRLDVVEWLRDDPYPVAIVADRLDGPWTDAASFALAQAEETVRRSLAMKAQVGDPAPPATIGLADALPVRAWQLVAIAPVPVIDRHTLLAVDDPADRLSRLHSLVVEECDVLARRLRL